MNLYLNIMINFYLLKTSFKYTGNCSIPNVKIAPMEFFKAGSCEEFERVQNLYPQALKVKINRRQTRKEKA